MCKSNTFNCLVLISDHTKGLYDDKWYGSELHYTVMGQEGDQTLIGNQNGTLFYSNTNGIEVHLFEVIDKGEYTYRGVVTLTGKPYQEIQPDKNGNPRKVWMFPITPIAGAPEYTKEKLDEFHAKKQAIAEKMSLDELKRQIKSTSKPRI